MVDKVEVEATTETAEVTPVEAEVTPPTAEERLATLQREYSETKAKLEQTEKGLNTAQSTLTRKDREFKAQSDLTSRISGIEDSIQILAGMVSKGELDLEDAQAYKKEFANIKATRARESETAALKAQEDAYIAKAQDLLGQAINTGVPEGSVLYETIVADLKRYDYELAAARLKEYKPRGKGESEDERIERLAEEMLRQKMEEKGQLNAPTSLPSGAVGKRIYTSDQIGDRTFYEANREDILKAQREGRIKD